MTRSRQGARDSWGVETCGGSAYGDYASYGTLNITGTTLTGLPGVALAKAVSTTTVGVTVAQSYKFLQPNVLKVTDTITNTSGGPLTGVVFQRDIDWDVAPTEFNENSFGKPIRRQCQRIPPTMGSIIPIRPCRTGHSCARGCNLHRRPRRRHQRHPEQSQCPAVRTRITYLYGISMLGENVDGLIAEIMADGGYYYIATQSSENGAYPLLGSNSAIIAVASSAIPEPSTWAMMGLGFAGLAFAGYRRGRKASVAIA